MGLVRLTLETMPRQTKLTPETYEKIVASVRRGNYFSVACRTSGVSPETGRKWLSIGRETLNRPELTQQTRELFSDFVIAIEQAEAGFESEQLEAIHKAAQCKTRLIIKTLADGSGETTEVEETGNWQIRAWILERRSRERWGRNQMPWMEALQVLVEENILPPSVLEVAGRGIKALREELKGTIAV